MLVGGLIYMDKEEGAIYLEGVEKPEILYCRHADIEALEVNEPDKEEDKIPPLFDVKRHPVLLVYPTIDEEMKVTGFTAKIEVPLNNKHKKK